MFPNITITFAYMNGNYDRCFFIVKSYECYVWVTLQIRKTDWKSCTV